MVKIIWKGKRKETKIKQKEILSKIIDILKGKVLSLEKEDTKPRKELKPKESLARRIWRGASYERRREGTMSIEEIRKGNKIKAVQIVVNASKKGLKISKDHVSSFAYFLAEKQKLGYSFLRKVL